MNTKQKIMDAALTLFLEKGYANVYVAQMRLVIYCVVCYEAAFREALGARRTAEAKKGLSAKRKALQKAEDRLAELDKLFKWIYEDMVNGRLNEARF